MHECVHMYCATAMYTSQNSQVCAHSRKTLKFMLTIIAMMSAGIPNASEVMFKMEHMIITTMVITKKVWGAL